MNLPEHPGTPSASEPVVQTPQKPSLDSTARISLELILPEDIHKCRFWVSFYKRGPRHADKVCESRSLKEQFVLGAEEGFKDEHPIMMVDSREGGQSYLLFIPVSYAHTQETGRGIPKVVEVISGWKPPHVGLYIAPGVFDRDHSRAVLKGIVQGVVEKQALKSIYLFTGRYGINEVINTAAEIKQNLSFDLDIFH